MFGRKKFGSKELGKRLAAFSGTSQDQRSWLRWLTIKTRTWRDLEVVMKGGALRAFKVRALTAMLCWDDARDPFEGRAKTEFSGSSHYAGSMHADLDSILPDVAAVIVNFCLEAIDAGAAAPEGARDRYNQFIPVLLANVKDTAIGDELFKRFRSPGSGTPCAPPDDRSTFSLSDYAFFVRGFSDE